VAINGLILTYFDKYFLKLLGYTEMGSIANKIKHLSTTGESQVLERKGEKKRSF